MTDPCHISEYDAEATEYDGCDGKTNTQQVQNHIKDDLRKKKKLELQGMQ